jgi:hypothetical protein
MDLKKNCDEGQKPSAQICLGCSNQHGCLYSEPPCFCLTFDESERLLSGRKLMEKRGLLDQCALCPLFRRCWDMKSYRKISK